MIDETAAAHVVRSRNRRKRPPTLRQRLVRLVALILAIASVPVAYSYVTWMLRPSSLPFGIRSVEWVRASGGAWFVNDVERVYYRWRAPKPGGPPLKRLPAVGSTVAVRRFARRGGAVPARLPARIRPVVRPALPGEGVWRPAGVLVGGHSAVLVAAFRPEATYPRNVAYVAWIDRTQTQVALYPGRYEPPAGAPRGALEVPYGERWRLLATFNSGFTYRDGHGGFAINGHMYEPLLPGLGTFVGYRDGRVDVVSWRGGRAPGPRVAFARQNLPLLVDAGRPNPKIDNGALWGSTLGNAVRVWRSAVGVDRQGNLVYLAADYQTAASLADAVIHAGAVRAIELDINAEWPSFITYALHGGRDPSKLVPNGQQPSSRYLVPDDRDFFAVFRRVPGRSQAVPFR